MDTEPRNDDPKAGDDDTATRVSVCETSPGRVVFTAEDNSDAWIATDYAVDVER